MLGCQPWVGDWKESCCGLWCEDLYIIGQCTGWHCPSFLGHHLLHLFTTIGGLLEILFINHIKIFLIFYLFCFELFGFTLRLNSRVTGRLNPFIKVDYKRLEIYLWTFILLINPWTTGWLPNLLGWFENLVTLLPPGLGWRNEPLCSRQKVL